MSMFRSLTMKLLAVFVPLVSLSVVLLFGVLEYRSYVTQLDGLEDQVQRLVEVEAVALTRPVWEYNTHRVQEILGDLQKDPNFLLAVVSDSDGSVLAELGDQQDARLELRLTAEAPIVLVWGAQKQQ